MRPTLSDKAGLMKIEVSQANPMSVQPLKLRLRVCLLLNMPPFRVFVLSCYCPLSVYIRS